MEIGARVWLRSGGPAMTVEDVAGKRHKVVWTSVEGLHRADFDEVLLTTQAPPDVERRELSGEDVARIQEQMREETRRRANSRRRG